MIDFQTLYECGAAMAHFLANSNIKHIFTDIDDTLTVDGRLKSNAYEALWKLYESGFHIVPVTGRPAGWCEMIARMWPVHGVVGENGGFYFCYKNQKMMRHFFNSEEDRLKNQQKLEIIKAEVLKKVPGAAIASDQFTRLMDLAIDFCEDVTPALSEKDIQTILEIYKSHGAKVKVSSIHINGWFGEYDKISMIKTYCIKELGKNFEHLKESALFIGDSPNDEPSFREFKYSAGVSNIRKFLASMKHHPSYISKLEGGNGFEEIANQLLRRKS